MQKRRDKYCLPEKGAETEHAWLRSLGCSSQSWSSGAERQAHDKEHGAWAHRTTAAARSGSVSVHWPAGGTSTTSSAAVAVVALRFSSHRKLPIACIVGDVNRAAHPRRHAHAEAPLHRKPNKALSVNGVLELNGKLIVYMLANLPM